MSEKSKFALNEINYLFDKVNKVESKREIEILTYIDNLLILEKLEYQVILDDIPPEPEDVVGQWNGEDMPYSKYLDILNGKI